MEGFWTNRSGHQYHQWLFFGFARGPGRAAAKSSGSGRVERCSKVPEGAWRIAEPMGELSGWQPVVEIGAQSLLLALLQGGRFGEEAAAFR